MQKKCWNISIIDAKIDNLKIEINSISIKTTYNESRLIKITKDIKSVKYKHCQR